MSTTLTPPAESSPAPQAVPAERTTTFAPQGEGRAEWLKTGTLPGAKPKEDSAPSKETSAEGKTPEEINAPASEAGKKIQEQRARSNADSRLNELLDDLRDAGLTPKALKSFKQDYQRTQQQVEPQKQAAPEQTANPTSDLKAPVKPKPADFEGKPWQEYEDARDKYVEDMIEYRAESKMREAAQRQQQEASSREIRARLDDAKKRYGGEAEGTIRETANEVFGDTKVSNVIKALVNDSPVMVDLLYALGGKAESLSDFLGDARTNPAAAIRKLVLVEKLVIEELAKGGGATENQNQRGEDGKFAKRETTPETTTTKAPPPPKEVSGQRAAPPDEIEAAYKSAVAAKGDARAFIDAENRRDLRRRKGL